MQKTLLLDRTYWDLFLDASGNIACATDPYSIAQDVASAVKTFIGECWYDTSKGITYWEDILGEDPPIALLKSKIEDAAMSVNSVKSAICTFVNFQDRKLSGVIEITDSIGNKSTVNF